MTFVTTLLALTLLATQATTPLANLRAAASASMPVLGGGFT